MANFKIKDDYDFGNITIDLGDNSFLEDRLTIDTLSTTPFNWNIPSYTVSAGGTGSAFSIGAQGSNGGTWSTTSGFNGSKVSTNSKVDISTAGIEVKNGADIKIGDRSLSDFMDRVESRLGILQPKPELLEKFEALKQAYEHYKTLEALCTGDIPKDPNGK